MSNIFKSIKNSISSITGQQKYTRKKSQKELKNEEYTKEKNEQTKLFNEMMKSKRTGNVPMSEDQYHLLEKKIQKNSDQINHNKQALDRLSKDAFDIHGKINSEKREMSELQRRLDALKKGGKHNLKRTKRKRGKHAKRTRRTR